MMPKLSWMTLARGPKQLVMHEVLLTVFMELSYLSWFTHHNHGGIHRRGRDDDPLGFSLQVSPILLHGGKDTSGLHNILSTSITPFDVGRTPVQ